MVSTYQKRGREARKTSLNVDKEASEVLGSLAIKEGLTKKDLVKKLAEKHKEACTH